MSSTYKKRVISESDDSGDENVPLAASASASRAAGGGGTVIAPAPGAAHLEAVASGSAILKEAGPGQGEQQPHVEDASLRQEIAAGGFPVSVSGAISSTGAHADHHVDKMDLDEKGSASEDDQPLASKKAGKNGTGNGSASGLPSFSKKSGPSSSSSSSKRQANGQNGEKKPRKQKKAEASSSSDDDAPLASRATSVNGNGNGKVKKEGSDSPDLSALSQTNASSSDDEDMPLAAKKKPGKKVKKEESSDDEDDEPLAAKKPGKKASTSKAKPGKKRAKKDEDSESDFNGSDSDAKPAKKRPKKVGKAKEDKTKGANASASTKKRVKKEDSVDSGVGTSGKGRKGKMKVKNEQEDAKIKDEDGEEGEGDDEEMKWWQQQNEDGEEGPKWTTLEHSGVLFPPDYEPLPSKVKLLYDGKPVDLPPESEEVAGFYGAMLETDHAKDATFQKNFFKDFLAVLAQHPPRNKVKIGAGDFERLDFRPMLDHFEIEKEKKKALTKDEKAAIKKAKDAVEGKFTTCLVDGREEKVGNFRLEPPGLFRGRGEHPKKGSLKTRLRAEDITINIGKDAVIPEPPAGHSWAKVQHDPNVTWLATWKENINNGTKYVFLAAGSSWKGQSDFKKFEKARKLKGLIGKIRQDYEAELTSKVMADRQRATAVYFIDRFALRVGNEKGEDEADTVGCCSLRYEHVTLKEPNLVTFDFLGKDSIRFYQPDKEVDLQVFKNLKLFKKGSEEGNDLFDRINPGILNKFFSGYMKGLSAKVFRTYNASILLQQQLLSTPADATVADKILHYNRANRLVAELCNHQRAASKTHGQAMEKLADKVRGLKYQRMKLRYTLWACDPDNKKKHKQYRTAESDLEDEWCEKYETELGEREKAKIRKKWEKDNEKRKAEGEKESTEKELEKLLKEADDVAEVAKEERENQHVEPKKSQTTAKVLEALVKMDERIEAQKIAAVDKEEGKEISLTTSKINYMDPRVTVAWCKKHGVPLEKMFSKTLRTKFVWAMDVEEEWQF